jgi:hypothetical protein
MAVLTLAGAHFSHQPISWSVVCMVLLIAMFAMAWNDLYDRSVDRQKGKTYAWEHPRRVAALVVILAVASLFTVGIAFLFRKEFGYLGLVMWLSSALYPFLQTRPYIKNATVTLTVGATVLFPLCIQYCSAQWLLFGSLCLLTSARELQYCMHSGKSTVAPTVSVTVAFLMYGRVCKKGYKAELSHITNPRYPNSFLKRKAIPTVNNEATARITTNAATRLGCSQA